MNATQTHPVPAANRPRTRNWSQRAGFTLLEVLIAIALLAAIAGLLISNLDRILGSGNEEIARIYVNETMETPLMTYRVHTGRYPSTEEGLNALLSPPSDEATNWKGPYVKKLPNDPWGTPYQYKYPGTRNSATYDIWSYGPDGKEGADDIGNWSAGSGDDDQGGNSEAPLN